MGLSLEHKPMGLLILFLLLVALLQPSVAQASLAPFQEEDIHFQNGDVTLNGTVLLPEGSGRHPAIVLIHGSGPKVRENYRPVAEIFAQAGFVTLIYDKRTHGYSTPGVGEGSRSYSLLADDAIAALEMLRSRADVDPAKIGVWGESEGGWVAPLAATRSDAVAFVITIGANGIPPIQQTSWAMETLFRHQGVSSPSMLHAITYSGLRFLVASEMFAEATYNPVPVLEQLEQPILAIWGSNERSSPPAEGGRVFQEALERGGNHSYTIQFIPDAEHTGRLSTDGYTRLDTFAPGYAEAMRAWAISVVEGEIPGSQIVGQSPEQEISSPPEVVEPSWADSGVLHLTFISISLLVFVGYFILALIRRFRVREVTAVQRTIGWYAPVLALLLLITPLSFFSYFIASMITSEVGPIVSGQPVLWLVLQLLAWALSTLTLLLALLWWNTRSTRTGITRAQLSLLIAGGLLFIPWAIHWRLFL